MYLESQFDEIVELVKLYKYAVRNTCFSTGHMLKDPCLISIFSLLLISFLPSLDDKTILTEASLEIWRIQIAGYACYLRRAYRTDVGIIQTTIYFTSLSPY